MDADVYLKTIISGICGTLDYQICVPIRSSHVQEYQFHAVYITTKHLPPCRSQCAAVAADLKPARQFSAASRGEAGVPKTASDLARGGWRHGGMWGGLLCLVGTGELDNAQPGSRWPIRTLPVPCCGLQDYERDDAAWWARRSCLKCCLGAAACCEPYRCCATARGRGRGKMARAGLCRAGRGIAEGQAAAADIYGPERGRGEGGEEIVFLVCAAEPGEAVPRSSRPQRTMSVTSGSVGW